MKRKLRIVFMGTPDFAVSSLAILLKHGYDVAGVVTAPDRPAGRGRQIKKSAVKVFAEENGLKLLQPEKLKDPAFIDQLKALNANLQVVVAFRMLPESVWSLPEYGCFNLHASLLPQYRGAAPINWAIINGEQKTGVTTFFIDDKIDTGKIIAQKEVTISPLMDAGNLHDELSELGANLVLDTVIAIQENSVLLIDQQELRSENEELQTAPKLSKENTRIDWNKSTDAVFNHIRGLSPYPAAYTLLIDPEGTSYSLKIFSSKKVNTESKYPPGSVVIDAQGELLIATIDGALHLDELQLSGKKRMNSGSFLRGFPVNKDWKAL